MVRGRANFRNRRVNNDVAFEPVWAAGNMPFRKRAASSGSGVYTINLESSTRLL